MKSFGTTSDVAPRLGDSPSRTRALAASGRIPSVTTPGGHRRDDLDEVHATLAIEAGVVFCDPWPRSFQILGQEGTASSPVSVLLRKRAYLREGPLGHHRPDRDDQDQQLDPTEQQDPAGTPRNLGVIQAAFLDQGLDPP